MRRGPWTVFILATLALTIRPGGSPVSGEQASVFPFVRGTLWTYAGTVRWTVPDSQPTVVKTNGVRWTSRVIDAFEHGSVAGALVPGPVWELAWWDPGSVPGEELVIRVDDRYYLYRRDARRLFAAVRATGRTALPHDSFEDAWFDAPLRVGVLLRPSDIDRTGTNYGWLVERAALSTRDTATVIGRARPAYRLTYETLGSDKHVTVVPGIGPTAFEFRHHGTVAEATAHLVAFRLPAAK